MTFEDLKKDKYAKEMLGLTINRVMYINRVQLPDDIIKDFLHLLDVGGFRIELVDKTCHHNRLGGSQGNKCLDCGYLLGDDDPVGF